MKLTTPFSDLLPPLSSQEYAALRASVEAEGVRDPIIIDELDQVLDGHHRLAIAPDAPRRVISGLTDAEKRAYVYQVNFARRNLSPDQKRERTKRMRKIALALKAEDGQKNTQERIATLLGVSQPTVNAWFKDTKNTSIISADKACIPDSRLKVAPKQKPVILGRAEAGEAQEQIAADYGITQQAISHIVAAERKKQEKRREREEMVAQLDDMGVQHGDFRDLGKAIPDASVDLIFTDPPYDKDAIPLYGDLAALAARVLRPGGWCLAYCGQTWLPQYLAEMSKLLAYGWTFAIWHSGGDLRYRKLKLQSKWKPLLGFYRPPLDAWWDWFPDMVSGGKEKSDHEWQQATGEAVHFIKALCPPKGVVLDPMAGSGTTCIATLMTDRQYIGIEQEIGAVETARVRIHKALNDLL